MNATIKIQNKTALDSYNTNNRNKIIATGINHGQQRAIKIKNKSIFPPFFRMILQRKARTVTFFVTVSKKMKSILKKTIKLFVICGSQIHIA